LGSKSAQKVARGSGRRQKHNKSIKSSVKTDIAKAEKLINDGNMDEAKKAVAAAITALDNAAGKKIFHSNNTARRKSRLMKKLNKGAPAPKVKTEKAKAAPEKAS
jgi:small subunit ribosomal protein S20